MNCLQVTLQMLILFSMAVSCAAQVRAEWIARYHNNTPAGSNQPLGIARDTRGNLLVAGTSVGTNGIGGYVVLKCMPDGAQTWSWRLESTNGIGIQANGFAVTSNGATVITGTGGSVKVSSDGHLVWTAPYQGRGVAVDTTENSYVTGFSTNDYATVKLDSLGSNVWWRFYRNPPIPTTTPTNISQTVAVDLLGNVFIAGVRQRWSGRYNDCWDLAVIKYSELGDQNWILNLGDGDQSSQLVIKALIPDEVGGVFIAARTTQGGVTATTRCTW